ncbi:MAG: hypothetical protein LQ343_004177 [Gyalolechia ehrenbergii]|nr:MAG: hypothetical protein LQ343_004177 [Gyalolechia ehrenbergii]
MCARILSDYKDDGTNVLLDANENAYGPSLNLGLNDGKSDRKADLHNPEIDFLGLNRYPDPHQAELKRLLCQFRNTHTHTTKDLAPGNLFVGVGSDEAIDALLRCFCTPGRDKILTCPPTYGMYAVSAQVNDVEVVKVPRDTKRAFQVRPEAINAALSSDPSIKLVYICSPGNPTANLVPKSDVQKVLEHPTWNGIVVLDEAYIDFSPDGASLAEWVTEWPNLVVMQTLSKAFGLAGIRLGALFASSGIARLLNNLKAPYNVSSPTSALATAALQPENLAIMRSNRAKILGQRDRMLRELPKISRIGRFLGGTASNFLLVEILDKARDQGGKASNESAMALYEGLAQTRGVVVRFRGKELGCEGCLRVTVGTSSEVDRLLAESRSILQNMSAEGVTVKDGGERTERKREQKANNIIA